MILSERTAWRELFFYSLFGAILFCIDRFAKCYALRYFVQEVVSNKYLFFELSYNRGISWSLFHSQSAVQYTVLSLVIAAVIVVLVWYWTECFSAHYSVWYMSALTAILAGACSNLVDRFFYHGVIDFIVMHYGDWAWPSFNIADALIVCGVIALLVLPYDTMRHARG